MRDFAVAERLAVASISEPKDRGDSEADIIKPVYLAILAASEMGKFDRAPDEDDAAPWRYLALVRALTDARALADERDATEAWFEVHNAIAYLLSRAGKTGEAINEIRKVIWTHAMDRWDGISFETQEFLESLATKVKQPARLVDQWLVGNLSQATAAALASYPRKGTNWGAVAKRLAVDINRIIDGPSIYDPQRFEGVKLRMITQQLMAENFEGHLCASLNRLLLEDAFPVKAPKSGPLDESLESKLNAHYRGSSSLARSRKNLAHWLVADGNFEQAESEFRSLLKVERSIWLRNCLAEVLQKQGKDAEAEVELRAVVAEWETALGLEHPNTMRSRNHLATVLAKQKKFDAAEKEYRKLLAIKEQRFGPAHRDSRTLRQSLAQVLEGQAKHPEVEALLRRDLELAEQHLGPDHDHTRTSRERLIRYFSERGKYGDIEALQQAGLKLHERVLGPEHPITLESLHDLAKMLGVRGKVEEAREFARRAVEGGGKVFGTADRRTTEYRQMYEALSKKLAAPKPSTPPAR